MHRGIRGQAGARGRLELPGVIGSFIGYSEEMLPPELREGAGKPISGIPAGIPGVILWGLDRCPGLRCPKDAKGCHKMSQDALVHSGAFGGKEQQGRLDRSLVPLLSFAGLSRNCARLVLLRLARVVCAGFCTSLVSRTEPFSGVFFWYEILASRSQI